MKTPEMARRHKRGPLGEVMPETVVRAYFGVAGAAEYLDTTERHVRELIYRREIPYFKVGRLVRFHPSDLDEWMNRNRVEVAR